jgi:hypothetical protein
VDRAEARRRRRRKGQLRLAALIAFVVLVIVVVLLVRACGGADEEQPAGQTPQTGQTAGATADATKSPKPVSSVPPLVALGETVRFQTPDGAVVRVTAADYADPGTAPDGVAADAGERLVSLKLSVTPEGEAGTAAVPLPFTADSFVLVMEDDTLAAARLGGDRLLGGAVAPGKTATATLAFSVGSSPPIRFVCTPREGSTPRSATWELE